jgi:hypothetical protein
MSNASTFRWCSSALVLVMLAGCGTSPMVPVDLEGLSLRLHVSGGFAGADLSYAVESDGSVIGLSCQSLCTFAEGDTLHVLTAAQAELLVAAIQASGIVEVEGLVDYGIQCCDQFEYTMVLVDDEGEHTIHGSSEMLPEGMTRLVGLLERYRSGVAPIVVDMEGDLDGWPADAIEIVAASVEAPLLRVTVRFGGGCERHDVDLVAWSGWRESFPVQVGVALTHDAHGDMCRALLTREFTFDLTGLREAYVDAYGDGPATLVIQLAPADSASGGGRSLDWSF